MNAELAQATFDELQDQRDQARRWAMALEQRLEEVRRYAEGPVYRDGLWEVLDAPLEVDE